MQIHIHRYDREVAAPDDDPTFGIILCTGKKDAIVRFILDKRKNLRQPRPQAAQKALTFIL